MNLAENARRINDAIQQGLKECRHSVAPLVALSRYIDELNANRLWRRANVAKVESAIRHILVRVIQPSDSGIYLPFPKP